MTQPMETWARRGAEARLREILQEVTDIVTAFPDLRQVTQDRKSYSAPQPAAQPAAKRMKRTGSTHSRAFRSDLYDAVIAEIAKGNGVFGYQIRDGMEARGFTIAISNVHNYLTRGQRLGVIVNSDHGYLMVDPTAVSAPMTEEAVTQEVGAFS